ncbi:Protein of unknown function DUF2877 [Acididesulfobacillus acetoxydans]|uniref:DUF2877 domain-containing protein n=1 Tax=Acididesulfobacillus acetoxydans TaxID=1561005 RepID=A0A8S0Y2L1_9FIRM|nr:DUF2877 domain-containing protein [Acididesulfobacillus acetoxydans]CAA7600945.1 Protein of unknown function DUF2877 [Acididesulfobacillus acetoxydans]CEJ08899.1 Protein of unknown function (DUF2877) [Acididesulfobacillus acetoxydans]
MVQGKVWGRDFARRIREEEFAVHSVFQSVCNLQADPSQPLLSLVNRAEALAPNALLVEGSLFRKVCRVGEKVQFWSQILMSGEYRVDCRGVAEEELQAPLQRQGQSQTQLQRQFQSQFRLTPPRSGPAALQAVETWLEIHFPGFRAEYSPLRQSLRKALLREDASLLHNVLSRLIGSGPGLTPAGDDFAAGVLLAYTRGIRAAASKEGLSPVNSSKAEVPAVTGCQEGLLPGVISAGRREGFFADIVGIAQALLPLTNAISQTMLVYAVRGEGALYVTGVVDGIYGNAGDVVAAAAKLSRIGASSGRYLLAGVLLGCEVYQTRFSKF